MSAIASTAIAALLGAGALLPLPAARTQPATASQDGPVVFAHRGASAYAPENTLAAVDAADDLGIGWVENDVHRTKDGELVVVHDTDLKRTTDAEEVFPARAPWAVKDFTAAEIAKLDAGSWFGERYTGARVPTLTQYLHRVDRGHVRSKLVIQSFGAESVRKVHEQRPDVITGFLGTPAVADLPEYAAFTDRINPSHSTVTADYVRAVHKLKGVHGKPLRVNTWTVNDAATAAGPAGYGVDGIITNNPDIVRDATR